jgi:hypothetical protein
MGQSENAAEDYNRLPDTSKEGDMKQIEPDISSCYEGSHNDCENKIAQYHILVKDFVPS